MELITVILLLYSFILCTALIYFIYQIFKSVHSISMKINEFSYKLTPIIKSTLELSEKLINITNKVESQLQITWSIVNDVRERADKILILETNIRTGIEDSVRPFVRKINAVAKGVHSFWKSYKSK